MKQAVRTGIYSWIRMVLAIYCLALGGLYPHALAAETEVNTPASPKDLGQQLFFDGRTTSFNRDMNRQIFEGDVVMIGAGTLIGADKITLDRTSNVANAEGSVILLNRNSLFIGDTITYNLATNDFLISNALMLANDAVEIERITQKVFGFGPTEVAFAQSRQQKIAEVDQRLAAIRREVARIGEPNEDLIGRYALLLEQRNLIEKWASPGLAAIPADRRDLIKRRRQFWKHKKSDASTKGLATFTAYLHIEGNSITRVDGNDYAARNALFTPCLCERGERPAWAFRADQVDAQIGGYADLKNAVLEIKGIPVLYLPYMKLPLKEKRQSGFLMPVTGFQQVTGTTYTQPIFFDLGPDKDVTATTDFFQNRGTRLGLEYRVQQRIDSGWNLKIEGIRDSLWMDQIGTRETLGDMYRSGYSAYRDNVTLPPLSDELTPFDLTRQSLRDRAYWEQGGFKGNKYGSISKQIDNYMATPRNSWRGLTSWRGVTYLAPRLSFVSNGEVNSDHRYTEELFLPDNFERALNGGLAAKSFAPAHAQLHLDGREFYAGIGSLYGDNFLTNQRYEGQQIPMDLKVQSRYFQLTPANSLVPIYAQLLGEAMQISQATADDKLLDTPKPDQIAENLGGGSWRRVQLATVSPLVTDSIVQLNHFTEFEQRFIEHKALSPNHSRIGSWVTGFEFRLPIDGRGHAPQWLRSNECEAATKDKKPLPLQCPLPGDPAPEQYIHHSMDWRLRIASRPVAVKQGPYANAAANYRTYFATDAKNPVPAFADVDSDVPDEERLNPYQRMTLSTDQTWNIQSEGWQKIAGNYLQATVPTNETLRERAQRELAYALERPVSNVSSMYDENTQRWFIDRFQLVTKDTATPLRLHADIAYDFRDAKLREQLKEQNAQLPTGASPTVLVEPWKPINASLGMNHEGWSLNLGTIYNIYRHAPLTESIYLTSPSFMRTTATVGYTLTKSYQSNSSIFQRTNIESLAVDTGIIPHFTGFIRMGRQKIDGRPTDYTTTLRTAFGVKYASPSACWGLQFAREKDYSVLESQANYVLRLSVIFMGQERPLPDMSGSVVQQTSSERTL
ncbi:MAG: hypothetical protein NTY08_08130 [Proteobacteria bacterium]|nr:hypothetical protein [Pseudomonadota bacterium]